MALNINNLSNATASATLPVHIPQLQRGQVQDGSSSNPSSTPTAASTVSPAAIVDISQSARSNLQQQQQQQQQQASSDRDHDGDST